ncbi:HNH endonuclease signature motif containing protein [Geodermatophilus obscurus]|uniref:HNH endonuclease n=1 Tax=Geodermatophilus obscurus TaxID=1861 RepID=UPI001AD934BD
MREIRSAASSGRTSGSCWRGRDSAASDSWLGRRCRATENLQADHVHPHSRGGSTTVASGQALCPRHNTRKANRVLWTWELDRLARRREAYFPSGVSTAVIRNGTWWVPVGPPHLG